MKKIWYVAFAVLAIIQLAIVQAKRSVRSVVTWATMPRHVTTPEDVAYVKATRMMHAAALKENRLIHIVHSLTIPVETATCYHVPAFVHSNKEVRHVWFK